MAHVGLIRLRVKVRSLADEARIIRHEERRAKAKARALKRWMLETHAAGTRIEHFDPVLARGQWEGAVRTLWEHRTRSVRHEARHAQLAAAFIRGRDYRTVEAKVRPGNAPQADVIASHVRRFGVGGISSDFPAPPFAALGIADRVREWLKV